MMRWVQLYCKLEERIVRDYRVVETQALAWGKKLQVALAVQGNNNGFGLLLDNHVCYKLLLGLIKSSKRSIK